MNQSERERSIAEIKAAPDAEIIRRFKAAATGTFVCGFEKLSESGKVELARAFLSMMPERWEGGAR